MIDFSQNYLIIDNTTDAYYEVKQGEGTFSDSTLVPYAHWTAITLEDIKTSPQLLSQKSRVVHLWKIPLGDIYPKQGDRITDAQGQHWIARRVEILDHDVNGPQRFRITAIKEPTL